MEEFAILEMSAEDERNLPDFPTTSNQSSGPENPPTEFFLNVQATGLIKRSTSSGAASISGVFNHVRRSILKGVGSTRPSSNNNIASSPSRLPITPRKSVSFHNLVHSSSVLRLALRGLSPKRQLPPTTETHFKSTDVLNRRRSPIPLPVLRGQPGSLKRSISNFVLTCESFDNNPF